MVEMICGAYGAKGRLIRPADGPFSLSAEEEKRLVNRGVARYVREYVESVPPVPPPSEPEESGGDAPAPEDTLDIVDGHFTPDSLDTMTKAELARLASDLGLDTKGCKNKPDLIRVIAAADVQPDDMEAPDLAPEGPVV